MFLENLNVNYLMSAKDGAMVYMVPEYMKKITHTMLNIIQEVVAIKNIKGDQNMETIKIKKLNKKDEVADKVLSDTIISK